MHKKDMIALIERLGCSVRVVDCGRSWQRLFVQIPLSCEAVQIGKISVRYDEVYSVKHYKPFDMEALDDGDYVFNQIARVMAGKQPLNRETYDQLIDRAAVLKTQDLQAKLAWRNAHPKAPNIVKVVTPNGIKLRDTNRRKGLKGRNLRQLVARLSFEFETSKENELSLLVQEKLDGVNFAAVQITTKTILFL